MALAPIAGNFLNVGSELFHPQPRDVAGGDFSAKMVEARADSGNDTLSIFLTNEDQRYQFAVSVIEACADKTVLAVQCTKGPSNPTDDYDLLAAQGCGSGAEAITVTEKPDQLYISTATSTMGGKATFVEDCKLEGTTAANCALSFSVSISGQSTATSTTTQLADATRFRHEVAVTAGAEKLAQATGKCDSAAAPGVSARAVALWGLFASFGVVVLAL